MRDSMVNKTAKGRRAEKEFSEYLKKNYYIWRPTWSRYGSKDIFNIADIIALAKKESNEKAVKLIQIKSHISDFYKARKKIREFVKEVKNSKDLSYVVALKIKGRKWRVWEISDNEEKDEEVVFNERESR